MIPKKFRVPENIDKLTNLIISSKIKIHTEEEAKQLQKNAKNENKSEDGNEEEEKQTGKTDDPVRLYLRDMGAVELLKEKVK